ncbi:MAG: hypothetical protein J7L94_16450 [Caldisericaceae bacterium]|nr:hypothetical protein [Caldisericaceae bacterium]
MVVTIELIAGLAVLLVLIVFLTLKIKEKNRLALFRILVHLGIEDMSKPFSNLTLDAIQRRYNLIHETLERAQGVAKLPEEKTRCEKLLKDLSEWRIKQIQLIYQKKLNEILKKYHETPDINRKLALLFEARNLITEGILPEAPLKKIDNLILRLYVMKARLLAEDKKERERYEIYEEYITKVLNSGIEDRVMDESKEFRELIEDFEILHRKFKSKRPKSE